MNDAVIVSTARTGLAKSWKGAFNMTYGATLAAHSIEHAVKRAGIDPGEVEDVILGAAMLEGTTGGNVARVAALRAGLPITTAGVSINRFCSSGLNAIAMAAHRIIVDGAPVMVGGTDSQHFANVSDHIYKFSPVRAKPEDLPRFHGTNERISLANLTELIRFYHRLVEQAAQ